MAFVKTVSRRNLVLRGLRRLELAEALGLVQQVSTDHELAAIGSDGGALVKERALGVSVG
jgi:hypothetical protein